MDTSIIIAIISCLIALGTYRLYSRNSTSQKSLTDREVKLASINIDKEERAARKERTADVSADLYKVTSTNWKLRVFNKGPATATNVRLVLDADNQIITEETAQSKFPMTKIENGQSVELGVYITFSMKPKEWLRIQWDDAAQTGNENRIEITL